MIAFFDANALIYLLEGKEPFASRVRAELATVYRAHPDVGSAVNRLSWLECRVGPMKANDAAILNLYDTFFAWPDLVWLELNRDVVELAAAIRVRHGLRTPDALQAACCLQLGPRHVFLTGDSMFQRVQGLNVVLLT
ncbi:MULTISPECIES: type II toxin-antitoxin system VapC family toxin [Serratia]|uniref:type II toxin-antitoxin system VapC family toxin n=1 Tax=Serratia TaxID=613 RepID=UPI0013DDD5F2|nr:type II toxin-antitoxin system VapC family toxin [Serratia sp. LS-1]MBH2559323.1 type II toxin-antitoxin system VapC family toxin [Serratia ureilytica]